MKLEKFDLDHKHRDWWLRFAHSLYNFSVCLVFSNGIVIDLPASYHNAVPYVCIII